MEMNAVTFEVSADALTMFWAKLGKKADATRYHPLLCHMVDVASVTYAMWRHILPASARQDIARRLGIDEESAGTWIMFLAGLHDVGKACPAFQLQKEIARERLARAGLYSKDWSGKAPHGTVSAEALRFVLQKTFGFSPDVSRTIAISIGGHHGIFPSVSDIKAMPDTAVGRGPDPEAKATRWERVRLALAECLADLVKLPRDGGLRQIDTATAMLLAGFVSVADWIGSNDQYFPYRAENTCDIPAIDMADYVSASQNAAERALRELGWLGWEAPHEPCSLRYLFPFITALMPVQRAAEEIVEQLRGPGIVIVEAPMGEGKTEAAMYLADHWASTLGQRGCYFALPTQATSNQMFGRVKDFLEHRYPDSVVNLQLLHGHAALSEDFLKLLVQSGETEYVPQEIYGLDDHSNVIAAEWFTNRKRGLLAPFGVGTVDQTLLAALATKHVFVRTFGLAYKTVIVDEVHAYDTYMSTLLARLLEWLAAIGTSVVLLSATLPRQTRRELIEAYMRGAEITHPGPPEAAYPCVTWVTKDEQGCGACSITETAESSIYRRQLELHWVDGRLPEGGEDGFVLGEQLHEALSGGGCAAIICNTVDRAQRVYEALQCYFQGDASDGLPVLDLFHARYPFDWRDQREKRVLSRFGKPDRQVMRPDRAVLVATQVIEQSLDLDFDLMVTDIAPIDLILQRAGRLHRHVRSRPVGLGRPVLWICEEERRSSGVPGFGYGTEKIYHPHMLLRTWWELRATGRDRITIPDDLAELIEAVYGEERRYPEGLPPVLVEAWDRTWDDLCKEKAADAQQAKDRYIKRPGTQVPLWDVITFPREEDAPELHPAQQAFTRLTEPTASIICLYGTREQPYLDPERKQPVKPYDTRRSLTLEQTRDLLRRSMTVSSKRIVFTLLAQEVPVGWQQSPYLRHSRLVAFDEKGEAMIGNYRVRLDYDRGLLIEQAEAAL